MPTPVSQELLDAVDANDWVTGVKTHGEVHSLGLMHRSVHILIFNNKGEMFIQKRSVTRIIIRACGIAPQRVIRGGMTRTNESQVFPGRFSRFLAEDCLEFYPHFTDTSEKVDNGRG